jgi:tRNA threonylcarbamoyl adenosine modification protein (Sua5/YciO/YrdC/YwlC family)/tRNA threonylcarbamoyl adenosine modification protein YjeE
MKIVKEKAADMGKIITVLNRAGLVIFPCETVYGAAVDCQSAEAVDKLNKYKQRPAGKPYAIMVSGRKMAEKYVNVNRTAENLYRNFLPGPLTVISTGKHKVADGVESESGSLGVRIPAYPFMLKLIEAFGRPIVATSANASYKKRPYKIADILDNISEKQKFLIDVIIDAGELKHNEPSTVIDTTLDDPVTLRQGSIALGTQNSVLSRSEENTKNTGKELWHKYEKHAGQRAIIFALEGPMGAGKTVFTKGLAKAMGVTEEVVSPTFNLNIQYSISNIQYRLEHIDAWRIQDGQELEELGLKGLISDRSVIVIEWADRVAETIRKYNEEAVVVWLKINYPPASPGQSGRENERIISWGVI